MSNFIPARYMHFPRNHPPPPITNSIQSIIAKRSLTRQRRQNLLLSRGVESDHLRHTRGVAVHKRCPDSRQAGLPEQRGLARNRSHGVDLRYLKETSSRNTHKGATTLSRRNRSQKTKLEQPRKGESGYAVITLRGI